MRVFCDTSALEAASLVAHLPASPTALPAAWPVTRQANRVAHLLAAGGGVDYSATDESEAEW